jgi:hypothetical protein
LRRGCGTQLRSFASPARTRNRRLTDFHHGGEARERHGILDCGTAVYRRSCGFTEW